MLRIWQRLGPMLTALMLVITGIGIAIGIATPVQAGATGCQNGGYYIVYGRGATAGLGSDDAKSLKGHLQYLLPNAAWAEVGNLDGDFKIGDNEYPASPVGINYGDSVKKGTRELIDHLNYRYSPSGMNCYGETAIVTGYSEGADLVGWAMEWDGYGGLSAEAKKHIGYVALYGDPKFDRRCESARWWVKGDVKQCGGNGILGPRNPYARDYLRYRLGSWCDFNDGFCNGSPDQGTHGYIYREYWYQQSAHVVAGWAILKRNSFFPAGSGVSPDPLPDAWSPEVSSGETAAPLPPVIKSVLRTLDPDDTNQVYAATNYAVTEGWWHTNGDGVHKKEIIHISQGDIVGFDKVNLPDKGQSLFTAVSDGIWETDWDAQHDPSSAKIVKDLSGVRQVIVDDRWEGANNDVYTHRLYVLASDGPHEIWWRDGETDENGNTKFHDTLLDSIAGAIAMTSSTAPDGSYELYVATPTWVYQLKWHPGGDMRLRNMINISQGDINSLSKTTVGGEERLFTGTSTSVWQTKWTGDGGLTTNAEVSGKSNLNHSQAMRTGSAYQIYIGTPQAHREYWYSSSGSGNMVVTYRSEGDITTFDKYNDVAAKSQQIYSGTTSGKVYETYWGNGNDPTTHELFSVNR